VPKTPSLPEVPDSGIYRNRICFKPPWKEKPEKNKYSRPRGLTVRNAKVNLRITSEAIEDILPVSSLQFSYYSK
jgi:hypothetical protein